MEEEKESDGLERERNLDNIYLLLSLFVVPLKKRVKERKKPLSCF